MIFTDGACKAAAPKPAAAAISYDGNTYTTAASAEQFVDGALKGRYLTWDFKVDDSARAALSLMKVCEKKKIHPGEVFDPSKWICRKCSSELPDSYPLAMLMPSRRVIGDYGEASQKDIEQFKKTKACPRCGNKTFCYITKIPLSNSVTKEDVKNIRNYFKYLASLWWKDKSGSKICDSCNESVARNDGYIYGVIEDGYLKAYRLYCNRCMDKMLDSPSLLPNLQKNPDYMGHGLVEKARAYAAGKR